MLVLDPMFWTDGQHDIDAFAFWSPCSRAWGLLGGGRTGSIGLLGSASLGSSGPGLFEPIHGSAPQLAGRDAANPSGAIASGAYLGYVLALGTVGLLADRLGRTVDQLIADQRTPTGTELVYRATRAAVGRARAIRRMAAGIAALVFLYWLSVKQDLATLEFVLSNGLLYIGIAIIVLFQSEIRQALITFGNRFRMPFSRHRGQFGEGVYDEVILAATTLASTKTGALIVIERNVGLKNVIDGGVQLDAELSYDLLLSIFNTASPLHDGEIVLCLSDFLYQLLRPLPPPSKIY